MMMFPGMTLADYLAILAKATPEEGPYKYEDRPAEEILALNTGFHELAKGMIAFVNAAKPIVGYEEVRDMLESVVHTFPTEENPAPFDPFAALQEALLKAMGNTPEAFTTEADGPTGAPKE